MYWDNKHSILLILNICLGVWIAVLLRDESGSVGERDRIKQENEILYSKIHKLNNQIRYKDQEIHDKEVKIKQVETRKNEVAIIHRDRIVSVANMTDDSVYNILKNRYIKWDTIEQK